MGGLVLLLLLVVIGTTIWVGFDASKRDFGPNGTSTGAWVGGCLLLWIIIFPMYLVQRGKAPIKDATGVGAAESLIPQGLPVIPAVQAATHRVCPHCKESMRRDAGTCPHCRKESPPWTFHEGRWWFRRDEGSPWQWLDERLGSWQVLAPPPDDAALQVTVEQPPTTD